jgi:alkylation response protein AidB-like acyl-CoA dehydrogenase
MKVAKDAPYPTVDGDRPIDGDTERIVRDRLAALLRDYPPATTTPEQFWAAQFSAGLAWADLPSGCGGLAVPPHWRDVVESILRSEGASFENVRMNPVGHGIGAVTLAAHGTDEQKRRFLPKLFTAEEIWCQLFSEPGSGSDLASLSTRAERHGDQWVVNGQKVWSSFALEAHRGLLLTRTDPQVPKHRGITAFALEMHTPGVDVRPLREMTGGAQFNEVFFTDVRVPDADRLGAVDGGWNVAVTTLVNERAILSGSVPERGSGPIGDLIRIWKECAHRTQVSQDRFMRLWVEAECMRLANARRAIAAPPGPDGSLGKLRSAELNQRIYDLCLSLLGPAGMIDVPGGEGRTYLESDGAITWAFARSRANTIEGGSSEVMRNIIAERVLGLPSDVRVDRDVTWSEIPRN